MDDFKFTEYHRQYCKELLEYHKIRKTILFDESGRDFRKAETISRL